MRGLAPPFSFAARRADSRASPDSSRSTATDCVVGRFVIINDDFNSPSNACSSAEQIARDNR